MAGANGASHGAGHGASHGVSHGASNVATAMAIAGRASRACDVCGSQRARWYCEADNAHLCHRCDQSVHSANALARRHERVRLTPQGTTSTSTKQQQQPVAADSSKKSHHPPSSLPSRKRSRLSRRPNPHAHAPVEVPKPRARNPKAKSEPNHEVPNFITVNIQESPISFTHDSATAISMAEFCKERVMASVYVDTYEELSSGDSGPDFLVPSGYLDDFESAIGAPIEGTPSMDDSFMDLNDEHYEDYPLDFSDIVGGDAFEGETAAAAAAAAAAANTASEEEEQAEEEESEQDAATGTADHQINEHVPVPYKVKNEYNPVPHNDLVKKEIAALLSEDTKPAPSLLRLNYEDVLSAWSDRSLWTDGKRPQTVPDDSNSEATGGNMDVGLVPDLSNQCGAPGGVVAGDGGREARVMRYREKRRTRLFSKKIRYEVRKLNAERRPRMKGRFVKRTPGCS